MFSSNALGKVFIGLGVVVLLGFVLFVGLVSGPAQSDGSGQTSWCTDPSALTPEAVSTPTGSAHPPTTATPPTGNPCYSSSQEGAAVVHWARAMADALYVNPACGRARGGNCNNTWYTSAFPKEVIAPIGPTGATSA